jgi:hypothetical protein
MTLDKRHIITMTFIKGRGFLNSILSYIRFHRVAIAVIGLIVGEIKALEQMLD